jgi:hypothetical protein
MKQNCLIIDNYEIVIDFYEDEPETVYKAKVYRDEKEISGIWHNKKYNSTVACVKDIFNVIQAKS